MQSFGRIVPTGQKHRITAQTGKQKFGALPGVYDTDTIKYPPGVACILTSEELINVDDWLGDTTGNQSNLVTTVGEMKTIIGIFYPSFYTHVRGNWTETEIREALTNDIEKAIFNFSDGNTKLVGPNGGHVMLFETPPIPGPPGGILGGFVNDLQCAPNTNLDSQGHMMPCKNFASNGALTRAQQALESACPECDIQAALILGCPYGHYDNPPGHPYSLAGAGSFASMSWTWTDGMVGWNYAGSTDPCHLAPGAAPGGYILENYIELIENGRVKRVLLHEIMHSLNWPHTDKPQIENTWCPTSFKHYGPRPPCDDNSENSYQYRGADNLCLMSLGGGCNNPYNVVEMHPTASTKYLRGVHSQGADGIWLPDNAVLSLDPSVGETHTIRLYAHDTPTRVKEDILRDLTGSLVAGGADAISTGEGPIPYLIKIKRPLSLEHCGSDQYCLADHDLFISYRREAWYSKKEEWNAAGGPPAQYWEEGGYQNGAMIIDWGPISGPWGQSVGGAGALSLYKYDAADVRAPNESPNQYLSPYFAEDGSPNSTTTGHVWWPKLEIKIIENVGNNPPAHWQAYSGQGPPSIVVEIKAL